MDLRLQPCPQFSVVDIDQRRVQPQDFRGRWLWLIFHRHLAWLMCREHVLQLQPMDWESRGVSIVVVSFEEERFVRRYRDETGLLWPLISDPKRELYRLFGMEIAKLQQIINWQSLRGYLGLVFGKRRAVKLPTNHDYLQLGGDVFVDPNGIIQRIHHSQSPEDRPKSADFLSLLAASEKE